MDLNYTPLADGFKAAKDENGNIQIARGETTLMIVEPAVLQAALASLEGAVAAAQPVADPEALTAANAKITQLQSELDAAAAAATAGNAKIAQLELQIEADKAAASTIAAAMAQAQKPADVIPLTTGLTPTIPPSNNSITGS